MNEIPPKVATAHRTKREVDFAEIKAWLTRFEGEDIDDMSREDLETDLEVATASYVPVLLDEVLDAERALAAAGIPDDRRPLAERVGALQTAKVTGVGHLLRRTCIESARALGAEVDPNGSGETVAQALRGGIETAQATLRAAKVLSADGTLGEMGETICRLADMLRGVPVKVEHRCADPKECPLCMAVAETDPAPQAADITDPFAGLTEEQRRHLTSLAAAPVLRTRFNGSSARIAVRDVPSRAGFNKEFGLSIAAADLARALGISEEDMLAIEAGTKATDDAGWTEIMTALFAIGSGMKPEHIADPESDPAFQQAMDRNNDDAPEETDPAPHWHRDRAVVVRTSNRLSVEAAREAAKATEALLQASARPPLTMIIAIARNGVIGKGDKIPWPISEDLRHFKRETMGHTLVVGRKTALSLPPLPGRSLVVLSRAATAYGFTDGAATIEDAIARARKTDPHPFVIGGAEVYRAAMPFVTRILLTEIDHDYEGDVRFELDRTGFVETSRCAGETPGVSFVTLERGSAS